MSYWIEKYKPNNIKDYEESKYKLFYNFKNIKNLLIYGEPGTGKSSYINLIAKNYFKNGLNDNDILSLNASDERGIDTVRNKIKIFCQKKINKNLFKLIILDECDSLTIDAQMSLRKILEDYKNTKFALICNYEEKIINPLVSRCTSVKFDNYSTKYILNKCLYILKNEKVLNDENKEIYVKYINKLIKLSKNDIRRVINNLQYLNMMKLEKYDECILNNLYGILSKDLLLKLLKNIKSVINIKDIIKLLSFYNINNILDLFLEIIIEDEIENIKKKEIIDLLSFIDSIKSKNIDYEIILYKVIKEYINLKK